MVEAESLGDKLDGLIEELIHVADGSGIARHLGRGLHLHRATLQVRRPLSHTLLQAGVETLKLLRHPVKRVGQDTDLIIPRLWKRSIPLPSADPLRSRCQVLDGVRQAPSQYEANGRHDEQDSATGWQDTREHQGSRRALQRRLKGSQRLKNSLPLHDGGQTPIRAIQRGIGDEQLPPTNPHDIEALRPTYHVGQDRIKGGRRAHQIGPHLIGLRGTPQDILVALLWQGDGAPFAVKEESVATAEDTRLLHAGRDIVKRDVNADATYEPIFGVDGSSGRNQQAFSGRVKVDGRPHRLPLQVLVWGSSHIPGTSGHLEIRWHNGPQIDVRVVPGGLLLCRHVDGHRIGITLVGGN